MTLGTWGPGYFDNDGAADFLLDLKSGGAPVLFETLSDLRDGPMTPELLDAELTVASVEVVTEAHGHGSGLAEVQDVLAKRRFLVGAPMHEVIAQKVDQADISPFVDALETYAASDVLADLGAKDDFIAAYRANIGDLATRAGRVS